MSIRIINELLLLDGMGLFRVDGEIHSSRRASSWSLRAGFFGSQSLQEIRRLPSSFPVTVTLDWRRLLRIHQLRSRAAGLPRPSGDRSMPERRNAPTCFRIDKRFFRFIPFLCSYFESTSNDQLWSVAWLIVDDNFLTTTNINEDNDMPSDIASLHLSFFCPHRWTAGMSGHVERRLAALLDGSHAAPAHHQRRGPLSMLRLRAYDGVRRWWARRLVGARRALGQHFAGAERRRQLQWTHFADGRIAYPQPIQRCTPPPSWLTDEDASFQLVFSPSPSPSWPSNPINSPARLGVHAPTSDHRPLQPGGGQKFPHSSYLSIQREPVYLASYSCRFGPHPLRSSSAKRTKPLPVGLSGPKNKRKEETVKASRIHFSSWLTIGCIFLGFRGVSWFPIELYEDFIMVQPLIKPTEPCSYRFTILLPGFNGLFAGPYCALFVLRIVLLGSTGFFVDSYRAQCEFPAALPGSTGSSRCSFALL